MVKEINTFYWLCFLVLFIKFLYFAWVVKIKWINDWIKKNSNFFEYILINTLFLYWVIKHKMKKNTLIRVKSKLEIIFVIYKISLIKSIWKHLLTKTLFLLEYFSSFAFCYSDCKRSFSCYILRIPRISTCIGRSKDMFRENWP